jgi:uncharacterized membrane protein YsdA (DUF1294 family)
LRRNWTALVYQSIAVVATAYATLAAHSVLRLRWLWAYLLAINLIAFLFFGFDKVFVGLLQRLRIRVPEKVLIWGLAFPGGTAGAWAAMRVFRHKTSADKRAFRLELRMALLVQVMVIVGLGLLIQIGVLSLASLDSLIELIVGLVHGFLSGIFGLLRAAVTQII